MTSTTKNTALAAAAAALLAGGVATGRYTATAGATPIVQPMGMRWLGPSSDAAHPYRYELQLLVTQGMTQGSRSVICETNGNPPSLDGYPYTTAAMLCADLAALADKVTSDVPTLSPSIASSNAPDMARSTVDAGQ